MYKIYHLRVTQEVFQMIHLFLVLMEILKKLITSNYTRITILIAYFIISEGLPSNFAQKTRFKKVLDLSRNFSKTYIPPNRNIISKELLDVIHEQNIKK